jgi:hypothetical protein
LTELRFFNVLNGVQAIERLERLKQAQAKIVLLFVKDRDAVVAAVNDVVGVPALLSRIRGIVRLARAASSCQRKSSLF